MFRILYCLLFDAFFIYILYDTRHENLGVYFYLILAIIALFTWSLIDAVKQWLK